MASRCIYSSTLVLTILHTISHVQLFDAMDNLVHCPGEPGEPGDDVSDRRTERKETKISISKLSGQRQSYTYTHLNCKFLDRLVSSIHIHFL